MTTDTENQQKGGSPGGAVRFLEVTEDQDGQRLDNFLLTRLKGVPKTRIYKALRKGEVRVNKGRVKPETRLAIGDVVRIPPLAMAEREATARPSDAVRTLIEQAIVFEDERLMIIDKPAGLAVHGGSGVSLGVIEALRAIRPQARFLELVHRLDRDTSGLLMVAKKRSALTHLHEALRVGTVDKRYHALVCGRWPRRKRLVDAPLAKNELKSGERMVTVSADGKPSQTEFRLLTLYEGYSLVEASPLTGRTHQIRVHAAFAGCPIAGDEKYSSTDQLKAFRAAGGRRLMLHAASLSVTLPGESGPRVFTAGYPINFQSVLDGLSYPGQMSGEHVDE